MMSRIALMLTILALANILALGVLRPYTPPSTLFHRLSRTSDGLYCNAFEKETEERNRAVVITAQSTSQASINGVTSAGSNSLLKSLGPVLASAFCVAAIMYPLDLVRALQMANSGSGEKLSTMQLLSNFKDAHGYSGFFKQGLAPELARSTWMRLLKFGLFPVVHQHLTGKPEKLGTAGSKALAAAIASVPEAISIMPLEIAKISLQLDSTKRFGNSMVNAMSAVLKEKSLPGFAIGYVGVQARQALWTSGYFASIGYFEQKVNEAINALYGKDGKPVNLKERPNLQVVSQLTSGFLAGVFGAALNTPFDTIRTTIQKRMLSPTVQAGSTTLLGVGSEIIANRGVSALYAGFQFKAMHLGGGGALMAFFVPFFNKVFAKY